MSDDLPAWEPCQDCEDWWCNIHGTHTHECACPETVEWDTDPYLPGSKK
jgi:hypothetical protein